MNRIVLVALGGAIGSVLRYGLSGGVHRVLRGGTFPFGTLVVNVAGCLAVGLMAQLAESRGAFTTETRVFVIVGLLGGFTTFSAFGNETIALARKPELDLALVNVAAQLVLGLGAVWLGRAIALWTWR